jgi:hypothetical protein
MIRGFVTRAVAASVLAGALLAGSTAAADAVGAVQPTVEVDSNGSQYLVARVNANGSVSAQYFDCEGSSCARSEWSELGGFVTDVVVRYVGGWGDHWFLVVGRGADGQFWFRPARCLDAGSCSYGPWRPTGGSGSDANLEVYRSWETTGCATLTVIGTDRAVWLTQLCTWGVGGWQSLGGVVTDISYRHSNLYGVDPWNRLWTRQYFNGQLMEWRDLGGHVRWPVALFGGSVAAVGADDQIWYHERDGGWLNPSLTGDVGDLRPGQGHLVMIRDTLDPYSCDRDSCSPLGGKVTSLALPESYSCWPYPHVAIGADGLTYYRLAGPAEWGRKWEPL